MKILTDRLYNACCERYFELAEANYQHPSQADPADRSYVLADRCERLDRALTAYEPF